MNYRSIIGLGIICVLSGAWWYQLTAAVCPVPLTYRIGGIDAGFSITREQALQYAEKAEMVWENEAGRDLFKYDPNGDLTIQFIFDERQQEADEEMTKRIELDAMMEQNETLFEQVESLRVDHQELSENYRQRMSAYKDRLAEYNREVAKYNDRGGAPSDIYDELEKKRQSLNQEANTLTQTAKKLNTLADQINQLVDRANGQAEEYNRAVEAYNKKYGYAREFTQGDFRRDTINIYKFSNEAELVGVLAHEFGHALGIGHVEDEHSVMYFLLENKTETVNLSASDIEAYTSVCGLEETFGQKVRRVIRSFL